MRIALSILSLLFILWGFPILAQQVPDLDFDVEPNREILFSDHMGPIIGIDGGHNNFHTIEKGFAPFAKLLKIDGYRPQAINTFTEESLEKINVLVIANPLHSSNVGNWTLPTPSAFTEEEINLLETWVKKGGSLLLIADHMPCGGAADTLAQKFGFSYENGFVVSKKGNSWPPEVYSKNERTLLNTLITKDINSIAGFTGSALHYPEGATPVAFFPSTHELLLPEVAWKFDKKTPRKKLKGLALGAYQAYGQGRIAFFTEAAMFTAQKFGKSRKIGFTARKASENIYFILNVMQWLSKHN